jgi:hypothetical protein
VLTRLDQEADRPADRPDLPKLAAERRSGRLVQTPHAGLHVALRDEH